MDCTEEDVELLLALQSDFKVQDTPPVSPFHPSSTKSSGYYSDGEVPKPKSAINMASFKPFVTKVATIPTVTDVSHRQTGSLISDTVDIEVFSGLKIKNRLVSTISLKSKLSDLRFIRLQAIRSALIGDNINGSWATLGVIADKGNPRVSTNGKNFVVWRLTVFDGTLISVFLFGNAYSCNWKESAGSVVVLFNAKVRREVKNNEFTLSVFSGDQVLLVGTAADFGVCKGKCKDGTSCNVVINRRQGEFCKYHLTASIQKYKTKRGELNGGNLATRFKGRNQNRHAQVIKTLEDTLVDKPVKRVKYLSSSELAKALSTADKVTTRTSSQGIRFLTRVADESSTECLGTKRRVEKKGGSTRQKMAFHAERTVLMEKVLNTIAGTAQDSKGKIKSGMMELDLEGSDDELEKALLLFRKT